MVLAVPMVLQCPKLNISATDQLAAQYDVMLTWGQK